MKSLRLLRVYCQHKLELPGNGGHQLKTFVRLVCGHVFGKLSLSSDYCEGAQLTVGTAILDCITKQVSSFPIWFLPLLMLEFLS